ncbi:N-acetyltransferase [uncultured Sulfitobacter sp.]|uniref:GNAT family N-acetyltransferase n=1 Tax=uncultured Sulfitobacter sp. TaxID=191468 RepID=UPI0026072FD5|nr:N-acetyltransferase [uncultured Sulfitobacter sp.]
MSIRRANIQDASSIAAISIEVWIGTYLKQGVTAFFAQYVLDTFTEAKIAARLSDPNEVFFVSDNAEGIDGFIALTQASAAPVSECSGTEISTFYVQPRHHGKGVGKRLLAAGLHHCRTQGGEAVWLTTNAENTPAIAFYLAQGFTHVGETHFTIEDQAYLNNVYACSLAP